MHARLVAEDNAVRQKKCDSLEETGNSPPWTLIVVSVVGVVPSTTLSRTEVHGLEGSRGARGKVYMIQRHTGSQLCCYQPIQQNTPHSRYILHETLSECSICDRCLPPMSYVSRSSAALKLHHDTTVTSSSACWLKTT